MNATQPELRCRFAPSPTGSLHVGGARTALFNQLLARSTGGTLVLRIEDTDTERSTDEAVQTILDGLDWLGIKADEGPYFQSQRFPLYQEYAKKLLELGLAYRCECSVEELDRIRDEQRSRNETPHYPGVHRPTEQMPQEPLLPTGTEEQPFVIRLRTPREGFSVFVDEIVGEVQTPLVEIDDFIIIRSNGTPTYNFVVVVDDIDMRITHIIRGMDHISNTPKQLLIYQALGATPPVFAHVPMILGPDKKKLSKRHGATSVFEYKKQGFLSDAFVNYIARLGWSYGDQEIFSREELSRLFSMKSIGKSAAVFDTTKLLWVNAEHLKALSQEELIAVALEELEHQGISTQGLAGDKQFVKLIESYRERSKTILELADNCRWYLCSEEEFSINPEEAKKHLKAEVKPALTRLRERLESVDFSEAELEKVFHEVVDDFQIKLGKLAQPVRVALTGISVSPPIYTVLEILGREKSLSRISKALKGIPEA